MPITRGFYAGGTLFPQCAAHFVFNARCTAVPAKRPLDPSLLDAAADDIGIEDGSGNLCHSGRFVFHWNLLQNLSVSGSKQHETIRDAGSDNFPVNSRKLPGVNPLFRFLWESYWVRERKLVSFWELRISLGPPYFLMLWGRIAQSILMDLKIFAWRKTRTRPRFLRGLHWGLEPRFASFGELRTSWGTSLFIFRFWTVLIWIYRAGVYLQKKNTKNCKKISCFIE